MSHMDRRWRSVRLSFAIAMVVLIATASMVATAGTPWSSEPPTAPPTPAPAATPGDTVVEGDGEARPDTRQLPGREPAPYFFRQEDFGERHAGALLHWTQLTRSFSQGSPDPHNGHDVFGELWLSIDTDGSPEAFFGLYTTLDGEFVQARWTTRNESVVLLSTSSIPLVECGDTGQQMPASSPLFVDEKMLADVGFGDAIDAEIEIPDAPDRLSATSVHTLTTVSAAAVTRAESLGDGVERHASVTYDTASGRFLGEHNVRTSPDGDMISEYFSLRGDLHVYADAGLPHTILQQFGIGGYCDG